MTPWVLRLIIANVAAYFLTVSVRGLVPVLMLVPADLLARPWTAVTYMFLHGGFWHLAFNMLALFFFGPRLEARLGGRDFLGLYFVSGLTAALLSLVFTPHARIIGASGAVFGVLLGFARFWPRAQIFIWGILPIEARWLVVGMTGLSLYFGFSGSAAGIAHFAHLGGFLGGYLYMRFRVKGGRSQESLVRRTVSRVTGADGPSSAEVERWLRIDPEGLHEVNREYYETLREKIREEGPGSLSQRERDFLERMSGRS